MTYIASKLKIYSKFLIKLDSSLAAIIILHTFGMILIINKLIIF